MKIGYEVKFVNSTNDYFVYNTKIIETPTVIRQIKRCLFRQIKTGLSERYTMV